MSFQKAEQLIDLATMAAARRYGVTLDDVGERYRVSRRTAQRMLGALETSFPETTAEFDNEGRKRWRLPSGALRDLLTLYADELAALDLAIEALGAVPEAKTLLELREKILALVPRQQLSRIEADHEALLEAQGLAARPGPRMVSDPDLDASIARAIKACTLLTFGYRSRGKPKAERKRVEPYGVLLGIRRYLVAIDSRDRERRLRLYRIEAMNGVQSLNESFERDPSFDLHQFAARAFGTYQDMKEFDEVVWRFTPEAAAHARGFQFHPGQILEEEPDGSLLVRFWACGHLEMCWHLYAWGDKVEVLAPEKLRRMCEGRRRSDFPALP